MYQLEIKTVFVGALCLTKKGTGQHINKILGDALQEIKNSSKSTPQILRRALSFEIFSLIIVFV